MVVEPSDMVSSVMTKQVHVVKASDQVKVALAKMVEKDIGSIVVVKRSKPVGIVTERDIIRRMIRDENMIRKPFLFSVHIEDIMSKPLITVTPNTAIWDALRMMVKNKIRKLPVVSDGKLSGIITDRDVFRWVIRVAYEPNIPKDIKNIVVGGY